MVSLRANSSMKIDSQFASFALLVRASAIDRRGVFAETDIPARRKVLEYAGERITMRQARRRVGRILSRRGPKRLYIARVSRKVAIDGAVGGSGAEYINHCCDPNLFARRSRGSLFFYSKRRIRKGQELTIDYRFGPAPNPMTCRCGSLQCRGTINREK
jgi:SET domain-containing protein